MKNVVFLYYVSLVAWCCGSHGATLTIAEEDYEQFLSPDAKTALAHRFLSPAKRIEAEEQKRLVILGNQQNPSIVIEWERNGMQYKSVQQFAPSNGREIVAQILLKTLPMVQEPWIVVWARRDGYPFEGRYSPSVLGSPFIQKTLFQRVE